MLEKWGNLVLSRRDKIVHTETRISQQIGGLQGRENGSFDTSPDSLRRRADASINCDTTRFDYLSIADTRSKGGFRTGSVARSHDYNNISKKSWRRSTAVHAELASFLFSRPASRRFAGLCEFPCAQFYPGEKEPDS